MRVRVGARVARRLLRYELERMCAAAGVTHAEMGARLGVSRASFSQAVAGKNLLSRPAMEVLATHLDVVGRLPWLIELLTLARGPLGEAAGVRDQELAIGLEAVAVRVEVFDPLAVTPLLQAPGYARGLAGAAHADAVALRQGVLTAGEPAELDWVADESALRRPVGGPSAMAEQHAHLLAMADLPNVTIRVLPAGGGPPRPGAFQLISTQDAVVACQETRRAAHYYTEPDAVADYRALFDELRERAYDPGASRDLIAGLGAPAG
ncbi:Scr1 family TA system antitoxin-like transcriptional regulator [Actinokineospora guangxiensis]|uniref:Scr1 family TA system antitoxin-like transcriptional regulator n=1 Tax=Actinokineospora guangxiensis TaxID=1490288 RepID=A0ABW0EWI1_9PSEU